LSESEDEIPGFEFEKARRDRFMIIRDALLSLEFEGRPMKPTILMYRMGVSWNPMVRVIKFLNRKKLVEIQRPEGFLDDTSDKRTKALITTTLKGKYMLRLLDEVLTYLYDETPPQINPPAWLMRQAMINAGMFTPSDNLLTAPDEATAFGALKVDNPHDESVIPLAPKDLDQRKGRAFTLSADTILPPIRSYSPRHKSIQLRAVFLVSQIVHERGAEHLKGRFDVFHRKAGEVVCPQCGQGFWGMKAINSHIWQAHPEKKEEIKKLVEEYQLFKAMQRAK